MKLTNVRGLLLVVSFGAAFSRILALPTADQEQPIVDADSVEQCPITVGPDTIDHVFGYIFPPENVLNSETVDRFFASDQAALQFEIFATSRLPKLPYFEFSSFIPLKRWGLFRISLKIHSSVGREIVIFSDARKYCQIVLGEQRARVRTNERWIERFGHGDRLKLSPGINYLHVDVIGHSRAAALALTLCDPESATCVAEQNWIATRLSKYVYAPNEPLVLEPLSVYGAQNVIDLDSLSDESPHSDVASPESHFVKEVSFLDERGEKEIEKVAIFDTESVLRTITQCRSLLAGATSPLSRARSDLETFALRLTYLLDAKNRRPERNIGERDLVEMLTELEHIRGVLLNNSNADWTQTPGRHFANYSSKLSEAPLPYMIFLPSHYSANEHLPLVVATPSQALRRPAFYKSYVLDFCDVVHTMTEAAEINNMIVVWPWAMNEEHTKELEYLVNECVTEVIRRYGADPTKVFAIGACAAGRDTIMLGGRSPLLYAGLAAHEVTLAGDTSEGRSDPASTPFSVVDRLKNIPVLLTHGSLDRHVSPETTILLYEKLRQPTGKTTMHIIAGADEGYYPESNNQWIWEGFAFFHIESIVKGGTAK